MQRDHDTRNRAYAVAHDEHCFSEMLGLIGVVGTLQSVQVHLRERRVGYRCWQVWIHLAKQQHAYLA